LSGADSERIEGLKDLMDFVKLIVVALLWGFTNPFLGVTGGKIATDATRNSALVKFFYLLTNARFLAVFALNQLGSVLFVHCLADQNLSVVVPTCNSLTFVSTAVCGVVFAGENVPSARKVLGMILTVIGVGICASC
jgi:multidrug transporter EmrE-like cation transporter